MVIVNALLPSQTGKHKIYSLYMYLSFMSFLANEIHKKEGLEHCKKIAIFHDFHNLAVSID